MASVCCWWLCLLFLAAAVAGKLPIQVLLILVAPGAWERGAAHGFRDPGGNVGVGFGQGGTRDWESRWRRWALAYL